MDLLFVYDDKIAQDAEGNYYVGSAFSQSVFDRYLEHFDSITLLMRKARISPDDTEAFARMNKLNSSRINVIIYPDRRESFRSFFSIRVFRKIRKIIRDNVRQDKAVIIRVPSDSGTYAARCCRRMGKPFLAEAVGCPWDSLWNHSIKGKFLAVGVWRRMKYAMKHAPYAVYVTNEFLQKRYSTNGIAAAISDVELHPMDDSILQKRLEKIENHSGKIKLATAAAVNVAFKGQQFVIEALAKLKEQGNTNFEYHLAGGGDNSALKNLTEGLGISEQVIFEGSLPHDKMFAWLDDMDFYIQPSVVEAMPRALIEAMSRGLPAFASRVGAMPELIGEKNIFAKKDVNAIAEYLNGLTDEKAKAMAEANFDYAKGLQKEQLEKKRNDFYAAFANAAKGDKA